MEAYVKKIEPLVQEISKGISTGDPLIIGIVSAVVVGILTLLYLIVFKRSNKNNGILIVGLCDAGKTLLFSRLVHKKHHETYTSIKENTGPYITNDQGKLLNIYDLPGHERVRGQYLDKYKTSARAMMFVVDSLNFQREIKDVAEYLYSLFTDSAITKQKLPILIVCNKQDHTIAKGSKIIKTQLQKEMNTLRITKSAALSGTDDSSSSNIFLGRRDKDFEFEDMKSHRIEFVECSAKVKNETDTPNLEVIEDWLKKIA